MWFLTVSYSPGQTQPCCPFALSLSLSLSLNTRGQLAFGGHLPLIQLTSVSSRWGATKYKQKRLVYASLIYRNVAQVDSLAIFRFLLLLSPSLLRDRIFAFQLHQRQPLAVKVVMSSEGVKWNQLSMQRIHFILLPVARFISSDRTVHQDAFSSSLVYLFHLPRSCHQDEETSSREDKWSS